MPLKTESRDLVVAYCKRDLPDLQWHVDRFSFVSDVELQKRLGRAFYAARYISKLMEALHASDDEIHPFVKFQVIQYASIYEAVISHLLWGRYKDHLEVKALETHKTYKPISALGSLASMKYDDQPVFTCVLSSAKTPKSSISFRDKVDCSVRIGFIEERYSEEIKLIYQLRNLAHIENEAERRIELEIEQARNGYWRMQPFLEKIASKIAEEPPGS